MPPYLSVVWGVFFLSFNQESTLLEVHVQVFLTHLLKELKLYSVTAKTPENSEDLNQF